MNSRIVMVITRMVPGGASTVVEHLIRGLGGNYTIDLITGEQDLPPALDSRLDHVNRIFVLPSLVRDIDFLRDIKALKELRNIFSSHDYDLVHTHTSKAGILGRWAGYWAGVSAMIHTPHGLVYDRPANIPGVPEGGMRLWLLRQVERVTSQLHDKMTALTNREATLATELGFATRDSVETIYNGIDPEQFHPSEERQRRASERFNLSQETSVLATVGRVSEEKGHYHLIEGFRELKQDLDPIKLIIAGDGPLYDSLKETHADLIEDGTLLMPGHVEEVELIYSMADIYVHPALFEGFGLTIVEAMASGCPVVATDVGGVPELVRHESEGLLVEPGDIEALTDAVSTILDDDSMYSDFKNSAIERAKRFDHNRMVEDYDRCYRECLQTGTDNTSGLN